MSSIIKLLFLLYTVTMRITESKPGFLEVALLLLVIASNLFREKYKDSLILVVAEAACIFFMTDDSVLYVYLYPIIAYDFIKYGHYYMSVLLIIPGIIALNNYSLANYLLILFLSGYFAHISRKNTEREVLYREAYDRERQLRYQLEKTKAEALRASKEIEHLTEVRERNRIAREIHDKVGHSLAAIMLQLEASAKLKDRNGEKSMELLNNSIKGLSQAIVVLRDTVHNIKPKEVSGLEYIEKIIENFTYCPVNFSQKGDMRLLKSHHIEIFCNNIKEALTNISKHSGATKVDIKLEANENYARLYIKDNGRGCKNIKEGLGLSGMKERIKYAGGIISVNGNNGFIITCLIPMNDGGDILEGVNSR